MNLEDLRRQREQLLADFVAGKISKEEAQAKCLVITRIIERGYNMKIMTKAEHMKQIKERNRMAEKYGEGYADGFSEGYDEGYRKAIMCFMEHGGKVDVQQ